MSEKDLTSFQGYEPDSLAIERNNLSVYEWYAGILWFSKHPYLCNPSHPYLYLFLKLHTNRPQSVI